MSSELFGPDSGETSQPKTKRRLGRRAVRAVANNLLLHPRKNVRKAEIAAMGVLAFGGFVDAITNKDLSDRVKLGSRLETQYFSDVTNKNATVPCLREIVQLSSRAKYYRAPVKLFASRNLIFTTVRKDNIAGAVGPDETLTIGHPLIYKNDENWLGFKPQQSTKDYVWVNRKDQPSLIRTFTTPGTSPAIGRPAECHIKPDGSADMNGYPVATAITTNAQEASALLGLLQINP